MKAAVCECCGRPTPSAYEEAADAAGLTNKERALFDVLSRAGGKVVRHSVILDYIWGHDPNGGPCGARNVLTIHAAHANAKLEGFGYRIVNVHSVGFRLSTTTAERGA
jgi:DNA-binding response OmpR family regulator